MSKVHIEVEAHFGKTTKTKGSVTIDRASRTISVRPRFGRESFILTLDEVADMISMKVLQGMALIQAPKKRRVRRVNRGFLSMGR